MGEIKKSEVLAALRAENPGGRPDEIARYADAYLTYQEAQENIDRNGAIVAHPRTGAPIENPYLKVRKSAGDVLTQLKRIRATTLWTTE
jgi:phage terminase small subunit